MRHFKLAFACIIFLFSAASAFAAAQLKGDTSTNWVSNNPTLAARQLGIETDTRRIKIGDGSTAWVSLPYITDVPISVSTTQATGNINIDGVSADHYYFNNGASAATYTPVITAPPTSGKERGIILTVGGGAGVCTMIWTNVSWIGTAGAGATTANKYSHYACIIPSSGNAKCSVWREASDN